MAQCCLKWLYVYMTNLEMELKATTAFEYKLTELH